MKKITYGLLGFGFMCLGFYNLKLTNTTTSDFDLAVVKSTALADDEDDDGNAYKSSLEQTGTRVVTIMRSDETVCHNSYSVHSIVCQGKGSVDCTPTSEEELVSSDC